VNMAINEWLHWYKSFRMPEPDDDYVAQRTAMGKALMGTLERMFPFQVRAGNSDKTRSMWCNENVHSKNPLLMYSTIRFGTASKAAPQGRQLYRAGVGVELAIKRLPARCLDH
jgi:hypothetical protein